MSQPPSGLPHARYERFESLREYDRMFDALVPTTGRVIRVFDGALSSAYNASARCEALRSFLRADPLNRLFVVLHDASGLGSTCPRFASLLQQFGHLALLRQTPRYARHLGDAFVIFDASHYLHRFHRQRMGYARGLDEITGAQQLLERFGELWEASSAVSAGRPLGL